MRTTRAVVLMVVGALQLATAADITLPEQPIGIILPTPETTETVIVSWGSIGEWERSNPLDIEREIIEFREFFNDEVVRGVIRRAALRMTGVSQEKAQRALAEIESAWNSQERTTDLVGVATGSSMTKSLTDAPLWMSQLAPEVRTVTILVFYDDRDLNQRKWLMETARLFTDNHLITVIAAGWTSRESLRQFMLANPGLPIAAFGDRLAKDYGVTHLPALVDFPNNSTVRFQVGYGRPAVVQPLTITSAAPSGK